MIKDWFTYWEDWKDINCTYDCDSNCDDCMNVRLSEYGYERDFS